jgi:hypothetical protein
MTFGEMQETVATQPVPGWGKVEGRKEFIDVTAELGPDSPKKRRPIHRKSTSELAKNTGVFIPVREDWISAHPELNIQKEYAGHPITEWELIQHEDHEQFAPHLIRLQKCRHVKGDPANEKWVCLLCGTEGSLKSGLTGERVHHQKEVMAFRERGFLPGQAPSGSKERDAGLFLYWLKKKGISIRAATSDADEIREILRRDSAFQPHQIRSEINEVGAMLEAQLFEKARSLSNTTLMGDASTLVNGKAVHIVIVEGLHEEEGTIEQVCIGMKEKSGPTSGAHICHIQRAMLDRAGLGDPLSSSTDSASDEMCAQNNFQQSRDRCLKTALDAWTKKKAKGQTDPALLKTIRYHLGNMYVAPDLDLPQPLVEFVADFQMWHPCNAHLLNLLLDAFLKAEGDVTAEIIHIADLAHRTGHFREWVTIQRRSHFYSRVKQRVLQELDEAVSNYVNEHPNWEDGYQAYDKDRRFGALERTIRSQLTKTRADELKQLMEKTTAMRRKLREQGDDGSDHDALIREFLDNADEPLDPFLLNEAGWEDIFEFGKEVRLTEIPRAVKVRWVYLWRVVDAILRLWDELMIWQDLFPREAAKLFVRKSRSPSAETIARRRSWVRIQIAECESNPKSSVEELTRLKDEKEKIDREMSELIAAFPYTELSREDQVEAERQFLAEKMDADNVCLASRFREYYALLRRNVIYPNHPECARTEHPHAHIVLPITVPIAVNAIKPE